jgi:hypothetical protein
MMDFTSLWAVDFEFREPDGHRPEPICMVAKELNSGHEVRLWQDELRLRRFPPYPLDNDALILAYYSAAEFKCHLVLGWGLPVNVIDPFVEFRNLTNNTSWHGGASLLGCAEYYGVPPRMTADHKAEMRELVIGGPIDDHRDAILDYCAEDVELLADIWPPMREQINIKQALLRGRYMRAAAQVEFNGVPIDVATFNKLKDSWPSIKLQLIADIDTDYAVFDGSTFKMERFARYLQERHIAWPKTPTGRLSVSDNTFRDMARRHPELEPLRQLRIALNQLKLTGLSVGPDGRNRTGLSPFRSVTGRNQPSNTQWIFGPSAWLRSLIKPERGTAIAYVDWSQQELGIAAALSRDTNMREAYQSGDFYLSFARQAGAVPISATKQSYPVERERFKVTALAVMYGGSEKLIAANTGLEPVYAKDLLRKHKQAYPQFWEWRSRVINLMHMRGYVDSVFGWRLHRGRDSVRTDRTVANFPMQSAGAEMLRLAICYLLNEGIKVIAPVHDAVLIEAPAENIDAHVAKTRELMAEASRDVLTGGLTLRTDVDVIRYPDRYRDSRGTEMWKSISRFLANQDGSTGYELCDQTERLWH